MRLLTDGQFALILHWQNLSQLYLTLRRLKLYTNHKKRFLCTADIIVFPTKIRFFVIAVNKTKNELEHIIFNSFDFKCYFNQYNLRFWLILAKLAAPGLLKMKLFLNRGHESIASVHYVTNKMLSLDPNYVLDVVMWLKIGPSRIISTL